MIIGKIIGNVVSVLKIRELKPMKLFLVQELDSKFKPTNNQVVALDSIGVGFGDTVIITLGGSSRFTKATMPTHNDATIVARIDNL